MIRLVAPLILLAILLVLTITSFGSQTQTIPRTIEVPINLALLTVELLTGFLEQCRI